MLLIVMKEKSGKDRGSIPLFETLYIVLCEIATLHSSHGSLCCHNEKKIVKENFIVRFENAWYVTRCFYREKSFLSPYCHIQSLIWPLLRLRNARRATCQYVPLICNVLQLLKRKTFIRVFCIPGLMCQRRAPNFHDPTRFPSALQIFHSFGHVISPWSVSMRTVSTTISVITVSSDYPFISVVIRSAWTNVLAPLSNATHDFNAFPLNTRNMQV